MAILAAHQPNFIPWLKFFDKMNKSDIFVLLVNCQYEKNGWTNRCRVNEQYWTMPVLSGNKAISEKVYVNGEKLSIVNEAWINAIAMTLGIDTGKIRHDFPTSARGTERIIELCKHFDCDQYLTNPEAMDKYLDEKLMNDNGIEVLHHKCEFNRHIFEMFAECGIEGTQKLIKREKCRT